MAWRWPEQAEAIRLNGVRPRRPEQCQPPTRADAPGDVSMESGLEDRNNRGLPVGIDPRAIVSMESGLEDRNNTRAQELYGSNFVPSQWSPA